MIQAHFPSQAEQTPDPFSASLDQLAQAVAALTPGRERQWTDAVKHALAGVERGLWQRIVLADDRDDAMPEMEFTRASLARQADAIRRHRYDFLAQAIALREGVEGAAAARGVPDLGAVRRGAADLVNDMQRAAEAETDLVQESVNTDLGAGD